MSPEKESTPEYPYPCPGCRTNLEQPGAVVAWIVYPERLVGHIEPGEDDGVNLALDKVELNPVPSLQCADCGEDLKDLVVEEMYLGIECEIEEDNEAEEDDKRE